MAKHRMSELERLAVICEALTFSRSARLAGSPVAAHSSAAREAIFTLWESYGRSKHASSRYRSQASLTMDVRKGGLVYDHAIPFALVHDELLSLAELSPTSVKAILERRLAAATITREEDQRLTALGLRSRMPVGWDGEDMLARYKAAGIDLAEETNRVGPERPYVRPIQTLNGRESGSFTIQVPAHHPKLQASSSRVRSAWEHIWVGLQEKGFELVSNATRDGFSVMRASGLHFKIDPKIESLRIKVGLKPRFPPPAELVHPGRQPNWIVVVPQDAAVARDYLTRLAD